MPVVIFLSLLFISYAPSSSPLTVPPYWDAFAGYRESLWLVDNNWNFRHLMFSEAGYSEGGPRTYLCSIYWIAVSLLLHLLSPKIVFLCLHLLIICCGCFIIQSVYEFVRKITNNSALAICAAITLATQPLFIAQASLITPEILLAAVSILAARALEANRPYRLVFLTWIAFFIKVTGCFIGCAAAVALLFSRAQQYRSYFRMMLLHITLLCSPLLLTVLLAFCEYRLFFKGGADGGISFNHILNPLNLLRAFIGLPSAKIDLIVSYTLLLHSILSVGNFVIGGYLVLKTRAAEVTILYHYSLIIFFMIFLSAWNIALPRYTILIFPSIFFLASQFFSHRNYSVQFGLNILVLLIVFSICNFREGIYRIQGIETASANGALLKRTPPCVRSHLYRPQNV